MGSANHSATVQHLGIVPITGIKSLLAVHLEIVPELGITNLSATGNRLETVNPLGIGNLSASVNPLGTVLELGIANLLGNPLAGVPVNPGYRVATNALKGNFRLPI
jgi:hypothetical protein